MMDRGKEYAPSFLIVAFVLVLATVAAGWVGFFIAVMALFVGAVVGAYYMAAEVRKVVAETEEEFGEQPFPFL